MMKLRDYQQECLDAVKDRYKAGVRRQLVCLPTGTGKTVIFAQFPRFFRMKKRMLVLAHREELLDQARDKIRRANPDLKVEVEQAGRAAADDADVVIASVPTLGRKGGARITRLNPDQFYLLVVDEGHHATAVSYRRTLDYFGVFTANTRKLLVGFTATPKRGDGQGLDAVFEEITFSRSLPDMMRAGYLAPLAAYRVETDVDLSGVKTRMGDFVAGQLSRAVNVSARNALVVKVYRERLAGRPTLVFCVDVAHAHSLAEDFRKANIACASVTGEMDHESRAQALRAFSAGKVDVLTNCMVLTEGYDETSIAGIILARPTKSTLLYTQMIGRGTRLHPGKKNVTVIDIVDVTRDQKLVSLPSLFGLPADCDLEGRTTQEAQKAFEWVAANRPWVRTDLACSLTDLRYRCRRIALFDLETPSELLAVSEYAWIPIGGNRHRLNLSHGERIVTAPTILGKWEALLEGGDNEQVIIRADNLSKAIRAADSFVKHERISSVPLVTRHTRWRRQPASEKQLDILRRLGIEIPRGLNRGQASRIIGMLPAWDHRSDSV